MSEKFSKTLFGHHWSLFIFWSACLGKMLTPQRVEIWFVLVLLAFVWNSTERLYREMWFRSVIDDFEESLNKLEKRL